MRIINAEEIKNKISKMCIDANMRLPDDVKCAILKAKGTETSEVGKDILDKIILNAEIAERESIPICQDTGMAVIFVKIGNEVHIDGDIDKAINEGVKDGYLRGYLRKSIVKDPILRENTNDNTPAVIHYSFAPGDQIELTVAPKGFGSENMSAIKMLNPSDAEEGIIQFVKETVKKAASNPCPPIVLGIGIGGNFELSALLSKRALLLNIDANNPDPYYQALEEKILNEVNSLNIGPQGFGGKTTALGVNILTFPTHIAGLPVAVNISCHVTRHVSCVL